MSVAFGAAFRTPQTRTRTRIHQWLLAITLMALTAAGQDDDPNHGVVFIYPTKSQTYNMLDTVNVTYTSPFPTPNLYLWCNGEGGSIIEAFRTSAPGFNATVPVVLNFTSVSHCWFNLRPGLVAGFGANSPAFDILSEERSSGPTVFGPPATSTSTPTPVTTPKPTSGTNSVSSGTGSTTGTATTQAPADSVNSSVGSTSTPPPDLKEGGLSVAVATGIGVGVALGILGLAGGLFAWIWRRRRRGRTTEGGNQDRGTGEENPHEREHPKYSLVPSDNDHGGQRQHWPKEPFLTELSSANAPVEISSSQVQLGSYDQGHLGSYELPAYRV